MGRKFLIVCLQDKTNRIAHESNQRVGWAMPTLLFWKKLFEGCYVSR